MRRMRAHGLPEILKFHEFCPAFALRAYGLFGRRYVRRCLTYAAPFR